MPRDDWARARSKDIGRRAAASGQCSKVRRSKKKKRGKTSGIATAKTLKAGKHLKMPFGKYRGRPLHCIPFGYMQWFVNNVQPQTEEVTKIVCAMGKLIAYRR